VTTELWPESWWVDRTEAGEVLVVRVRSSKTGELSESRSRPCDRVEIKGKRDDVEVTLHGGPALELGPMTRRL
jgi:hypothetical protein